MKARIKETGVIVDIENLYDDGTALIDDGGYIKVSKLDFIEEGTNKEDIDWKKVRIEIAISLINKSEWQGFNEANELTKKLMDDIK